MLLRPMFFSLATLVLLSACTAGTPSMNQYSLPYPPADEPQAGDILHLPTGYAVDQETVVDHARRAQVVYVGETHDNPAAHQIQKQLLADLQRHHPGQVTLAMEMFTPSQQPLLDRWIAGELTEKAFLRDIDWYGTWGFDFALYRDLLHLCREEQIRILGLNAENDLRRSLSRMTLEQLPAEDRSRLPELDFDDPHYLEMIDAFVAGHPMSAERREAFLRVQTLWDETMAENLANYLQGRDSSHRVMVVAGGNHIAYGFGIPRRTFRRFPASYLLIGTTETEESRQLDASRFMDVDTPEHPLLPYHFLYYTAYQPLPQTGVRLGVVVSTDGEAGLLIDRLLPESAAEAHGLQAGDVLLTLDGVPLSEPFDLIYPLKQKTSGETVELMLLRDAETLTVRVEFTPESQRPHGMPR